MPCSVAASRTLAALFVALGCAAGQSHAGTLLDVNFDTTSAGQAYAYRYPNSVVSSTGVTAGVGVGGSNALTITSDSTAASADGFWGMAFVVEKTAAAPTGVTSLGDLVFSVDAAASGFKPGVTSTTLRLTMRFHDGATLLEVRHNLPYNATLGGFQTFAGDFSSGSVLNGSLANLLASTKPVTVRMTAEFGGGSSHFGFDAGNVGTVDNVSIGVVPEPASVTLLAVGGFAVATRRRPA